MNDENHIYSVLAVEITYKIWNSSPDQQECSWKESKNVFAGPRKNGIVWLTIDTETCCSLMQTFFYQH